MSAQPTARRLAWLAIGALVGLAGFLLLPERPASQGPGAGPPQGSARHSADAGATAAGTTIHSAALVRTLAPRAVQPMNRANRAIQLGEDLHELALELLPLAEADEAEAQYSLSQIIEVCANELARFADETELARRREELLERAAGIHGHAAVALDEERYRMCDGFRQDPLERFGERAEWLRRAVEAGHPLASVALALELDRGPLPGDPPLDDAARIARQRELFLAGLASGRPEALWEGFSFDAGGYFVQGSWGPAPEGVAWLLLACARGMECSRAARWRREWEMLAGMPPYDDWTEALLFDLPLHQREAALSRAHELAAALDRSDLDSIVPEALRDPPP